MKPEGVREFILPKISSILFGAGSIRRLRDKFDQLGSKRALIVTVEPLTRTKLIDDVKNILGDKCAGVFTGVIQHVPRESVLSGADYARGLSIDSLVSLGGSSATDTAKAINTVLTEGDRFDELIVRRDPTGKMVVPSFAKPKLPVIAIPTTLSGAEFTDGIGVTDTKRKHKDTITNENLAPRVIILDPEATVYTPADLWTSTGLKTFSDCFEGVCSPFHTPFVDALCLYAVRLFDRNLVLSTTGADPEARGLLQQAVWMTMFSRRTVPGGIIAALRHQIGARYNVPHGIASTIVLPYAISFNRPLIDERLGLIAESLGLTGPDIETRAKRVIDRIFELIGQASLPRRLRDVNIPSDGLAAIAESAIVEGSVKTNPKPITSTRDLLQVLEAAW